MTVSFQSPPSPPSPPPPPPAAASAWGTPPPSVQVADKNNKLAENAKYATRQAAHNLIDYEILAEQLS
jgi:hypothetical protein